MGSSLKENQKMKDQPKIGSRRQFIKSSAGLAALSGIAPYWLTTNIAVGEPHTSANDRPTVGCIGTGDRWLGGLRPEILKFADIIAVCDVDAEHANQARAACGLATGKYPDVSEDYRYLLDRNDIDTVSIATPDHWHTKIAIEALQSDKDVYCEKPVTLTIDEGKKLCKVAEETGRVFQVGTQQRTEMGQRFLKAIAIVRDGRLGEIKQVRVAIGPAPDSQPIPVTDPPKHLNWERWLGQAPLVDYRYRAPDEGQNRGETRCHYECRWWYEYGGGKLTDWGAHHVDIAQWAIGMHESGPNSVEVLSVTHPVPLEDGFPTQDDRYNTATVFNIRCQFPNDVTMFIRDEVHDEDADFGNGILLEGTKGRIFVSRSSLTGKPVEDLVENPLPEDAVRQVYGGKTPSNHMGNFFDCVKTRDQPISDIFTHHRILSTCHLANIAMRLGRTLKWDPVAEQIVGDKETLLDAHQICTPIMPLEKTNHPIQVSRTPHLNTPRRTFTQVPSQGSHVNVPIGDTRISRSFDLLLQFEELPQPGFGTLANGWRDGHVRRRRRHIGDMLGRVERPPAKIDGQVRLAKQHTFRHGAAQLHHSPRPRDKPMDARIQMGHRHAVRQFIRTVRVGIVGIQRPVAGCHGFIAGVFARHVVGGVDQAGQHRFVTKVDDRQIRRRHQPLTDGFDLPVPDDDDAILDIKGGTGSHRVNTFGFDDARARVGRRRRARDGAGDADHE